MHTNKVCWSAGTTEVIKILLLDFVFYGTYNDASTQHPFYFSEQRVPDTMTASIEVVCVYTPDHDSSQCLLYSIFTLKCNTLDLRNFWEETVNIQYCSINLMLFMQCAFPLRTGERGHFYQYLHSLVLRHMYDVSFCPSVTQYQCTAGQGLEFDFQD